MEKDALQEQRKPLIDEHDERRQRCRMLGGEVTFGYCRKVKEGLPCWKVLDCWFEHFPVQDFVREHYSEAQREQFLARPKPKILSLVELIEQAQAAKDGEGESGGCKRG